MNRSVELLDFFVSDLDDMDVTYFEGEDVEAFRERLHEVVGAGEAKLVKYKDKIRGALGYHNLWPGVCEVWAIPNEPIKDKGIYALTLKYAIEVFIVAKGFHRMQATVLKDDPSENFFIKLGFKSEGVLEQYDSLKQDYRMWARIM